MKEIKIDNEDTDVETDENDDNDDNEDVVIKDNNRLRKSIRGFNKRGNNYFKHCNKEKIETICRWCSVSLIHDIGMRSMIETLEPINYH